MAIIKYSSVARGARDVYFPHPINLGRVPPFTPNMHKSCIKFLFFNMPVLNSICL